MNSDATAAALAGASAGLAIAMPLGAISVLLLRAAMLHGLRAGLAGGLAVGSVDLVYCAAAVTVGSRVAPLVESWGAWPLVMSGLVVIGIGAYQLRSAQQSGKATPAEAEPGGGSMSVRPRAIYARFVALTALNPLTLLYFVALAAVLAQATSGAGAKVAFVAGTGFASISWQVGLVSLGAIMHKAISARTAHVLGVVASFVVMALGVGVIVKAVV